MRNDLFLIPISNPSCCFGVVNQIDLIVSFEIRQSLIGNQQALILRFEGLSPMSARTPPLLEIARIYRGLRPGGSALGDAVARSRNAEAGDGLQALGF
ncbi:hypothetical protein [Rhizobium miluonense]|uniref:Uncharacterized protein n=1 Tax=Rhizobium miluonense TaxID=411945 RepID=A0ABU1SWP4_9HYPH|nr:hypothetical protein [Rhizobium miluonense]MDR6903392.1 hypothetical protein [Rhizobium miluonense]